MWLKCSLEVESLITASNHFFGLFFKDVGLTIGRGTGLRLGWIIGCPGFVDATHQCANMILLVTVGHERYFRFRWYLWKHGLGLSRSDVRLLSHWLRGLHLFLLWHLACLTHATFTCRIHTSCARCSHLLCTIDIIDIVIIGLLTCPALLTSRFNHLS